MVEPRERVALVDLTSLTGEETDADIAALCEQAQTPAGPVAAVCVYGAHVTRAVAGLEGTGIPVAAVSSRIIPAVIELACSRKYLSPIVARSPYA